MTCSSYTSIHPPRAMLHVQKTSKPNWTRNRTAVHPMIEKPYQSYPSMNRLKPRTWDSSFTKPFNPLKIFTQVDYLLLEPNHRRSTHSHPDLIIIHESYLQPNPLVPITWASVFVRNPYILKRMIKGNHAWFELV